MEPQSNNNNSGQPKAQKPKYRPRKKKQQKNNNKTNENPPMELSKTPSSVSSDNLDEVSCLICTEPIETYCIGVCNHIDVCAMCSLRRRELYKEKNCCICKTNLSEVIFAKNLKSYEDYQSIRGELIYDSKLNIYFEEEEFSKTVNKLWEYKCTICDVPPWKTKAQLKRHMKTAHNLVYCTLCSESRKVFNHEQTLYNPSEINNHNKLGDPQQNIPPHPLCKFCNTYHYDNDAFYEHLHKVHETCHICERNGTLYQYFKDYNALEKHFREDHFLCLDPVCLQKKFIVFETELDLKTHQIGTHVSVSGKSKHQQRAATTLPIQFNIRRSHYLGEPDSQDQNNNNSNNNNNNNRNRNNNNNNNTSKVSSQERIVINPNTNSQNNNNNNNNITSLPPGFEIDTQLLNQIQQNEKILENIESAESTQLSEKQRNLNLIKNLKEILTDWEFDSFKIKSAQFRKSEITPQEYFSDFFNLSNNSTKKRKNGDKNYNLTLESLFIELVDLLPDKEKQNQLTKLYQQKQNKKQNLKKEKPKNNNPQFPSLSNTTNNNKNILQNEKKKKNNNKWSTFEEKTENKNVWKKKENQNQNKKIEKPNLNGNSNAVGNKQNNNNTVNNTVNNTNRLTNITNWKGEPLFPTLKGNNNNNNNQPLSNGSSNWGQSIGKPNVTDNTMFPTLSTPTNNNSNNLINQNSNQNQSWYYQEEEDFNDYQNFNNNNNNSKKRKNKKKEVLIRFG